MGKTKRTIYHRIYTKLQPIIKALGEGDAIKLESSGFMDLHVDRLYADPETGELTISMAHYYKSNGDLIPDPDMEMRLYPDREMAEALSYQDTFGYRRVYTEEDGKRTVYPKAKKDLNHFLNFWLRNIKKQGFFDHDGG